MINHEHKFIFIHIPKSAGISVRTALGGARMGNHENAPSLERRYPDLLGKYFIFTFVRNPWDRVVSAYLYNLKMSNTNSSQHDRKKIKAYGIDGFNDYVLNDLQNTKSRFFLPCSNWIKGYKYDFIGKLENFQDDMGFICEKMKIPYIDTHLNMSKRDRYSDYYNEKSKKIIEDIYRDDISMFNYTF